MAYTPTTWATGDTVTATKMNKIENGIAGAGSALICNCSYSSQASDYVLDKTVQEIYNALLSGTPAYIKFEYGVLGTDYESHLFLAPIIKIYSYDTANVIRIIASRPVSIGYVSGYTYAHSPAVLLFSAGGLAEYPKRYASVEVPYSNVSIDGSLI